MSRDKKKREEISDEGKNEKKKANKYFFDVRMNFLNLCENTLND